MSGVSTDDFRYRFGNQRKPLDSRLDIVLSLLRHPILSINQLIFCNNPFDNSLCCCLGIIPFDVELSTGLRMACLNALTVNLWQKHVKIRSASPYKQGVYKMGPHWLRAGELFFENRPLFEPDFSESKPNISSPFCGRGVDNRGAVLSATVKSIGCGGGNRGAALNATVKTTGHKP